MRFWQKVEAADVGGIVSSATVHVYVSDVNDQEPTFVTTPYSFRVKEGAVDEVVGTVKALDTDIEKNAQITYKIDEDEPFSIDESSGEIRTKTALDFESLRVHYLVVTAMDTPEEGQVLSSSATVTVLVQDTSDEVPVFLETKYTATVPENEANFDVIQVEATDKDTNPSITYRIIGGDINRFTIDSATGMIRTSLGLDYEQAKKHRIVVGTEEGRLIGLKKPGATCEIEIFVEDRNDKSPQFFQTPLGNTIQIRNDIAIGESIGLVRARDDDGTEEFNIVRYSLSEERSSDFATKYFYVDENSGEIVVKDDLKQELYEVYVLEIVAYDSAPSPLVTPVTIVVQVQQVVTVAPGTGIGFKDIEPVVTIDENVQEGSVISTLDLEKSLDDVPDYLTIDCSVEQVSNPDTKRVMEGVVLARLTDDSNSCEVIVTNSGELDRETNRKLLIEVKLKTLSAFSNAQKAKAIVTVNIRDVNDNPPRFIFKSGRQYFTTISDSVLAATNIFQVNATDEDSSNSGIKFRLSKQNPKLILESFSIDPITGQLATTKDIKQLKEMDVQFPLTLEVSATDNSNDLTDSLSSTTLLTVRVFFVSQGS